MGEMDRNLTCHSSSTVMPTIFDENTRSLSPIQQSMSSEPNRTCPLCKSEIRLFFINFNDKMLMCENTECEFPFGYEDLQFVKENNTQLCDMELDTKSIKKMSTPAASVITGGTSGSDIEKINRACLSEDSQSFENQAIDVQDYINNVSFKKPSKTCPKPKLSSDVTEIQKCAEEIRKCNESKNITFIKDEEKLLELVKMQKKLHPRSQILSPLEMCIVKGIGVKAEIREKKEETVKIDIKKEDGNIFQIDLELLDDGE